MLLLQFCQSIFNPLVIVFTVTNLLSMGLQVNLGKLIKIVGNPKFPGLMLALGWVVGPAVAYLITLILPLDNSYVIVLFIGSLAPCAPFSRRFSQKLRETLPSQGPSFRQRRSAHPF